MTLTEIIEADAKYMQNVTVHVDYLYSTVCIVDDRDEHEDIFLYGKEAEEFMEQCSKVYEEAQDALMYEVELHLAKPYVENIWG